MKFIKIQHGGKDPMVQWRLVIDNIPDLLRYKEGDIEATTMAWLHMPVADKSMVRNHGQVIKSALADETNVYAHGNQKQTLQTALMTAELPDMPPREQGIARMLAAKMASTPEGEKVYPMFEIANSLDKKFDVMANYIQKYGQTIMINSAGGWCDLEGYIDMHKVTILETVEKERGGFPVDDEALNVETLILENASRPDNLFVNETVKQQFPNTSIGTITNLKEIDERYVYKCICNAKNIAVTTQAQDEDQINAFVQMFLAIKERKNIFIATTEEGKERITSNPNYKNVTDNHTIQFGM